MANVYGTKLFLCGNFELIFDDDDYDSDELSEFLDSLTEAEEITEGEFADLTRLLDEQIEAYENNTIFDADYFLEAHLNENRPEAESEDAKIWREIAENLERENGILSKFHNLLLIQLMANGTLGLLGTGGMWN